MSDLRNETDIPTMDDSAPVPALSRRGFAGAAALAGAGDEHHHCEWERDAEHSQIAEGERVGAALQLRHRDDGCGGGVKKRAHDETDQDGN